MGGICSTGGAARIQSTPLPADIVRDIFDIAADQADLKHDGMEFRLTGKGEVWINQLDDKPCLFILDGDYIIKMTMENEGLEQQEALTLEQFIEFCHNIKNRAPEEAAPSEAKRVAEIQTAPGSSYRRSSIVVMQTAPATDRIPSQIGPMVVMDSKFDTSVAVPFLNEMSSPADVLRKYFALEDEQNIHIVDGVTFEIREGDESVLVTLPNGTQQLFQRDAEGISRYMQGRDGVVRDYQVDDVFQLQILYREITETAAYQTESCLCDPSAEVSVATPASVVQEYFGSNSFAASDGTIIKTDGNHAIVINSLELGYPRSYHYYYHNENPKEAGAGKEIKCHHIVVYADKLIEYGSIAELSNKFLSLSSFRNLCKNIKDETASAVVSHAAAAAMTKPLGSEL